MALCLLVHASFSAGAAQRPIVVVKGHAPTIEKNCPGLPDIHVQDLTCSDAAMLVSRLKEVQTRLKNGEDLYFDLLSGAPASDPMTKVSPREAFLNVSFDKAFIVERVGPPDNLSQRYKFAYRPDRAKPMIWDIEVLFLFKNERLGRVQMRYGPPPPF
ncbi:MAG TPA: hypothetical protein VFK50_05350 [Sphingomicrobium sp.]|nr:hypothetical protein [Sphingomicrobium sp.]